MGFYIFQLGQPLTTFRQSNMASWEVPDENGGLDGKLIQLNDGCSSEPCLIFHLAYGHAILNRL